MNGLFKKKVFEVIYILEMLKNIRIFNFSFMDKIKNLGAINIFVKLRLIVQTYNNYDKMSIFTQLFTILYLNIYRV